VALGLLRDRVSRETLAAAMPESRRLPDLLQRLAVALLRDRRVTGTLVGTLAPADGAPPLSVLAAAAAALGRVGDYGSVEPLLRLLEDRERGPLARAFAAVALGLVAERRPLPWNAPVAEDLNYRAALDFLLDPASGTGILDIL
jgi:HEAT repeat protein